MPPDLKLDWASYEAAAYACKNWHYSKSVPVGKLCKVGVWENKKFIGVVLFARGANNNMLKPYNLSPVQGCELVRIALTEHIAPVSKIISIAISYLKKLNPKLELIVSYADSTRGHHGGVYQASNWIYAYTSRQGVLLVNGEKIHRRTLDSRYGHDSVAKLIAAGAKVERLGGQGKHCYLMPLNKNIRKKISPLAKPYPKRAKQATDGDPPSSGGATPTGTLHLRAT